MGQVACRCGHGMERHVQKQRPGSTVIEIVCAECNNVCRTID
ncbi:MAG: hypothetical protein ACE5KA_00025 [Nitrososphaerales archaeon]